MTSQTKVLELERKVNLLAKVLDIMLLKSEKLSKKEIAEVKSRLDDWVKGKKSNFVSLGDALHGN